MKQSPRFRGPGDSDPGICFHFILRREAAPNACGGINLTLTHVLQRGSHCTRNSDYAVTCRQSGPKSDKPCLNSAITSVNVQRF